MGNNNKSHMCCFVVPRPPLPESSMEKMKRFKRRLSQTLRGSHTIDESLSELAEQMTIEENGLKDSGGFYTPFVDVDVFVGESRSIFHLCKFPFECFIMVFSMFFNIITWFSRIM